MILLEAAAKRKMQACQKKIKQFGRRDMPSPSSESSSLEDLHTEPVKQEPKEKFFCPDCGAGDLEEEGTKCAKCKGKGAAVKEEARDEEAGAAGNGMAAAVPGGNAVQAVAVGWQGAGRGGDAGLRTKNDNFYKPLNHGDGTKTYMCRKCFLIGGGTTSHTKDSLCAVRD